MLPVKCTEYKLYSRTSCKRTTSGPEKKCPLKRGVHLREVKNVFFLYVVGTMPKCLPTGGVRLQEVSVSGGSTVILNVSFFLFFRFLLAISLSAVRQVAVTKADQAPTLRAIIPYLEASNNQEYLVQRLSGLLLTIKKKLQVIVK